MGYVPSCEEMRRPVQATQANEDSARDRARRASRAGALAWGGWLAVSLGCGVAVALAQYASLARGHHDRLDTVATVIACGGAGVALLCWLWWLVVHIGRWRVGVAPSANSSETGCAFFLWLIMAVGGAVVMAAGGNADSLAPPALLALGLGCACTIGGFSALFASCGRWFADELRADRRRRAEVRAAARARGMVVAEHSWATNALSALGFIVPASAMVGCYEVGPWVATTLRVPVAVGAAVVIALGTLICFPSLVVFIGAHTSTHELLSPEEARAYRLRSAALATAGFIALGVLPLLRLGALAVVLLIGIGFLADRLRRRYLGRR